MQYLLAYLTRLTTGQLVYSTQFRVQSTGLFAGQSITSYVPSSAKASPSFTLWLDESIYNEQETRAQHPTCYLQIDTAINKPTGHSISVADYKAQATAPADVATQPSADAPL